MTEYINVLISIAISAGLVIFFTMVGSVAVDAFDSKHRDGFDYVAIGIVVAVVVVVSMLLYTTIFYRGME